MNMLKYICSAWVMTFLLSCSNFLEEKPVTFLSPSNFYTTEADANSALNAIYKGPQERYSSMWGAISWFSWATDECELTSGNSHAFHNEPARLTTSFNPSSDMPWYFWDYVYRYVRNCNYLLANIDNIAMDANRKKQVVAQARAFRALFYFDGVRVFNGMPLILEPIENQKTLNQMKRNDPEILYQSIEADLLYAIDNLPIAWEGAKDGGRLTKGSAAALLAKVYLTWAGYPLRDASKLPLAKNLLENFVDKKEYGGQYDLFGTYAEAFAERNIPGKESVWTINFTRGTFGAGSDIHTNLAPLELYNAKGLGLSGGGGWSNGLPTKAFYDSYDQANDQRFKFSYWTSTADIPGDYADVSPAIVFSSPHCKKFRESRPNDNSEGTGIDHYIIRYADVLLMYAEVLNELGDNRCYNYLNQVRHRAGLTDLPVTDQTGFRNHLMLERAWEFAFEGDRRFDLVRWGVYYDRVKAWNTQAGPNVVKGKHELWPVPLREININPNLEQNPYY